MIPRDAAGRLLDADAGDRRRPRGGPDRHRLDVPQGEHVPATGVPQSAPTRPRPVTWRARSGSSWPPAWTASSPTTPTSGRAWRYRTTRSRWRWPRPSTEGLGQWDHRLSRSSPILHPGALCVGSGTARVGSLADRRSEESCMPVRRPFTAAVAAGVGACLTLSLTNGLVVGSATAASTGGHPDPSHGSGQGAVFQRLATFPVYLNSADPSRETVAEITAASTDGRTLISTDSPGERVTFTDITDPRRPRADRRVGRRRRTDLGRGLRFVRADRGQHQRELHRPERRAAGRCHCRTAPCPTGSTWAASPTRSPSARPAPRRRVRGDRDRERARRGRQRRRDPPAAGGLPGHRATERRAEHLGRRPRSTYARA